MSISEWLREKAGGIVKIGLALALLFAGWTVQGWRKDASIATLLKDTALAGKAVAESRAEAAEKVLAAERLAREGIQAVSDKLTREKEAANVEKDAFITGVRNGSIRLSVPVTAAVPAAANCRNSSTTGSNGEEARAELTPEAAEFLNAIADEGDDAIRNSNAVIDAYNKAREALNVQAGQP